MKKDDIVTIRDFSWSKRVTANKRCMNDQQRKYVIVEVDCTFPLRGQRNIGSDQPPEYRSDTIVRAIGGDNEIILIHGDFLRPVAKPIREVTMAEVCAQFDQEVKIKKD